MLLFAKQRKKDKKKPLLLDDSVRDNIYYYDEEGGGEDDQVNGHIYAITHLHKYKVIKAAHAGAENLGKYVTVFIGVLENSAIAVPKPG